MKILLLPKNNSLSHIAKCLVIKDVFESRGHQAFLTCSLARAPFLQTLGTQYHVLPDIQETDGTSMPTFAWFRNPQAISDCIRDEVALMKKLKPDRVLGVFRFTGKLSAQLAGVPYDSLICGCMIPECSEVLGMHPQENGYDRQREAMNNFFRYAGRKMGLAAEDRGVPFVEDARQLLKGERTFLWDFPEFQPLEQKNDVIHVGPIFFNSWPDMEDGVAENCAKASKPLAVVTFGTGVAPAQVAARIVRVLVSIGYAVLLAACGNREIYDIMREDPRVIRCHFAPLDQVLPHAQLLVCHGGQLTIFKALLYRVPALVMPLQPEQQHNGLCLERIGCGARLILPEPFYGDSRVYLQALNQLSDDDISSAVKRLDTNPEMAARLSFYSETIDGCGGAELLVRKIEESACL
jgi:UDP:flavonoid glycosyltransferase YjiC (YdhE family)